MCVCLLITNVSCAKTAEPIEIPFGIWTRVGPGIRVLTGGFGSTTGNGTFGGYISACPNLTAIDILNVVRCDAAFGYQSVYCSNLFCTILRTFRCAEDESADVRLAGAGFDGDLHLVVRQWSQTVEPIGRYGPIVIVVNHDHRSPNLQRFFLVRVHLSAHGQQFNRRMKACLPGADLGFYKGGCPIHLKGATPPSLFWPMLPEPNNFSGLRRNSWRQAVVRHLELCQIPY